ncbi:MAG: putative sulfate exporter family transporter [Elusimicrobia bacterium]|nr:putative sulfate exporter family transporter [Elusimicrobiota bacterium]
MAPVAFFLLLALTLTPWASPPAALVAGILFGLLAEHPYASQTKTATKTLLQASVVGLGFGIDLQRVLQAGASGLVYTAGGIAFSLAVGSWLGRRLSVPKTTSYLISTGTAICGGSAIAAVGPIIGADSEEMSVSLGTVFLLNSVALLLFPAIGLAVGLTQEQFGYWAALAIHDTSSVVGASAKYGAAALAVGTTVKLARALWIVPVSLGTAAVVGAKTKTQWPWFILFFAFAAAVNTYFPAGQGGYHLVVRAARAGLTATLFLIGTGISPATLKKVGVRPLALGVILWILVAVLSLALIRAGFVA